MSTGSIHILYKNGGLLPAIFLNLLLVFFPDIQPLHAQKSTTKIIDATGVKAVGIDLANCAQLTLRTHSSDQIIINAVIEGEYKNDLSIQQENSGSYAELSVKFLPSFSHPNDKLSAHKVIPVNLEIYVPEKLRLKLWGGNTFVLVRGKYDTLNVTLKEGSVESSATASIIQIKTQSGSILIETSAGDINAQSKYGNVAIPFVPLSSATYTLSSIRGDITVRRVD